MNEVRPEARSHVTLVFDLDGTLVHSSPDIAAALNATLAEFGKSVSLAQTERMVGGGLEALLARALKLVEVDLSADDFGGALDRLRARYRAAPAALSSVHGWVADVLMEQHRAGARIAVCSNKDEDLVVAILDALDLTQWMHGVAGFRPGEPKKPSPDPLLRAIALAGGASTDAVMIGDSAADVGAARAAGIPVILVPHGYGSRDIGELGADGIASNATELAAAITDSCAPQVRG